MADRPVLFGPEMARAIYRETKRQGSGKTQDRRAIKLQPTDMGDVFGWQGPHSSFVCGPQAVASNLLRHAVQYAVGDRLWVRETWAVSSIYDGMAPRDINPRGEPNWCGIRYAATDNRNGIKDRSSATMPRWASRITLMVTDVRVQRLQEITLREICAEGLAESIYDFAPVQRGFDAFREHWDSINADDFRWDTNPFVVAYAFRPILANIDDNLIEAP